MRVFARLRLVLVSFVMDCHCVRGWLVFLAWLRSVHSELHCLFCSTTYFRLGPSTLKRAFASAWPRPLHMTSLSFACFLTDCGCICLAVGALAPPHISYTLFPLPCLLRQHFRPPPPYHTVRHISRRHRWPLPAQLPHQTPVTVLLRQAALFPESRSSCPGRTVFFPLYDLLPEVSRPLRRLCSCH